MDFLPKSRYAAVQTPRFPADLALHMAWSALRSSVSASVAVLGKCATPMLADTSSRNSPSMPESLGRPGSEFQTGATAMVSNLVLEL